MPSDVKLRVSRAERARRTRHRILDTAQALFVEHGYAATTMDRIGSDAGVAVQTVYYTFRTKGALLCELMDRAGAGEVDPALDATQERPWFREVATTTSAQRAIALGVEHGTEIYRRASALWPAVSAASAADTEVAEHWRAVAAGRRRGQRGLVARLAELGALRADLDVERGTDLLAVLHGPEVYRGLVVDAGWPPGQYKAWLFAALVRDMVDETPDHDVLAELTAAPDAGGTTTSAPEALHRELRADRPVVRATGPTGRSAR